MMKPRGEKHKEVSSTQLLLKERLSEDPNLPHGYYVMAETQTSGRGRSDHRWESISGNLHVSILLRDLPFSEINWIPHWISVCVFQGLIELGVEESKLQLKWPNDLWTERSKKIAGILCEKTGDLVIVGIGVNLAAAPLPEAGVVPSCEILSPEAVLNRVIFHLNQATSTNIVRTSYEKNALFRKGDEIKWKNEMKNQKMAGTIFDLGLHGELLVMCEGKIISLFTENVCGVRPE
jgi:biotin-[acetyl-CoA-carboxylase] ligase BirA-like protein